ncbi:ABC transporter substrate-binding protein [Roseisalinus antarcticus]|uniref:Cyclodextrin-binding protein n=1 Tax=Roseisalinus antarcticus TaxID=254357 RepID=A0A1Y5U4S9_9RHOB|nr:sugar ABC transporter substrate-binding protein [Roseisalinus antarcticus]SLN76980.1 Cyclodextrin-binding protein precursor [Roseisalinus antarcticus]
MSHNRLIGGLLLATVALPAPVMAETFSLWVRADGSNFMPQIVEAFNAQSEHSAELQIVPTAELVQKYAIASAGGSAPDALSLDLIYTPAFGAAGQLRDLTEFAQDLDYFDSLSPAHLSVGTVEDRIYGLPFSADSSVLIWNKDLYREAGLDPDVAPTTWAEIREHAEAIDALGEETYGFYFSGACGGCNIFTFMPMVWASGGELFSSDGSEARFDSPQMREGVEFYRAMVEDGLVPAGSQTDGGINFFAAFANGNIGITPSGAFAIGALNTQYPDLDYGVSYLPGKDGAWSSFAGGDNFVVSAATDDDKMPAIEAFIEFAYSLEGQRLLAAGGALPVRSDIAEEALEGLDPRYILAADAMTNGRTPFSPVFNDLINSANGPWITTLNRAFYGTADEVGETLAQGEAEMQSIIDDAN